MELNEIENAVSCLSKAGFKPSQCEFVKNAMLYGDESTIQKTEADWLRWRGIGKRMLPTLRGAGMVMSDPWPSHLSARARTALKKAGIGAGKLAVKDALEKGHICLTKPRNLGIKTLNELRIWVGLSEIDPNSSEDLKRIEDLERRLAIARDLLACINSSQIMDGNIHRKISETLKQTAPL